MKRIVASIGAAAIGSTALQQAQAVNLTPQESTKPWSVGVALRGFYDDNYLIAPRGSTDGAGNSLVKESFGFEVRPTVGLNVPLEQTYFGLDLTYSGQWYEDRDDNQWDHTFLANALLNHQFTQRLTLDVTDRFVYSDRPELSDPSFATTTRTDQNNISNLGTVALNTGISPRLGFVIAYRNFFIDYENENPAAENPIFLPPGQASLSARLDRLDHYSRESLRLASVIGREFAQRLLEQISTSRDQLSQALEELKILEMIQQIRVIPEAEYMFKHVITQEVTYETLLHQKRKELHGMVGQAIEELYHERIEEQVSLLYRHFSLADDWPQAAEYGRRAANRAYRLGQYQEAVIMFDNARISPVIPEVYLSNDIIINVIYHLLHNAFFGSNYGFPIAEVIFRVVS